jgi:hypothetical protein
MQYGNILNCNGRGDTIFHLPMMLLCVHMCSFCLLILKLVSFLHCFDMYYLSDKWKTGNVACCLGQEEKRSEGRVMAGGQKNVQEGIQCLEGRVHCFPTCFVGYNSCFM